MRPLPLIVTAIAALGCGGMGRNDSAKGVQLYQQGNYFGAVNHFQDALARQPGNPDCFYNLGATYHQQAKVFNNPADRQVAEQYYHLCLARNPDHVACQRALAVLLVEDGRSQQAVTNLQQWAVARPTNPQPHIELARLAQEHGDTREAENQLVDALAIDPHNPRALVALGQLREAAGDQSQALANYSRALALDPRQPVVAARVATLSNAAAAASRTAALPPTAVGVSGPQPPFGPVAAAPLPPPTAAR
ncbi:MAG: tetratricopeptide repeat protein [Planctomycetes bacterium]|nr:tetratricopeptide repeat protein [Planctomycetota bacterium]